MTTNEMKQQTLSTNAKVFLNDWRTIRDIIKEHTKLTTEKNQQPTTPSLTALFSDRQLTDALSGPYQAFFKEKLSAYATIAKLRLTLNMTEENKKHPLTKDLASQNVSTTYSLNDIDKMQNELDTLTKEHHKQWQALLAQWDQLLIAGLTANQVPLTDREQKELQDKEPLSELLNRFTDLNLELPSLDFTHFNYPQYLKLKMELVIVSSLSRRHETHTASDIDKVFKKLKSEFDRIAQEEKKVLKKQ